MLASSALTLPNIENEVDRYIGMPGQACSYMIGRLEIDDLRSRVTSAQGGSLDLREFHDTMLGNGSLPMSVLRSEVSRRYGLAESL